MFNAIKNFTNQLAWGPNIKNSGKLKHFKKFVVLGMGGSNHATDLIKLSNPNLDIIVHRDYGLPALSHKELREHLIIASSYSGNTEEPLDGFEQARKQGLVLAVVAIGGKLLERAKKYDLPYIQMPDTGIQPRSATGFSFKSLLKLMGQHNALKELSNLAKTFRPLAYEVAGRSLAKKLKGHIPVIYSSTRNWPLANNWKIKFNENTKIPAFYNVIPELNHNEMTGFDVRQTTKKLFKDFYFIFLQDKNDHPKVVKRMAVLKKLYEKRGLPVEIVPAHGKNVFEKIFASLVLADWTTYYLALEYKLNPDAIPMVEEFKKMIK